MIIKNKDGSKRYYYYKKKRGRKKKRGPKRKPKLRGRRWQETWDFKIVTSSNKKQNGYIGKYRNIDECNDAKRQLLELNNKVVFPSKYLNDGRKNIKLLEKSDEYLILKRVNGDTSSQLRNEFGKIITVEAKSSNDNWQIFDRFPRLIEETFWCYGYNPKVDRKTFMWVFDNFLMSYCSDKYNVVQIFLYNNKIIFKYGFNDINFVICKNVSDAIRMYNLLQEKTKKLKNVVYTGMVNGKVDRTFDIVRLIEEKTGWTRNKIYRKNT